MRNAGAGSVTSAVYAARRAGHGIARSSDSRPSLPQ
jgi:hypothetical protein